MDEKLIELLHLYNGEAPAGEPYHDRRTFQDPDSVRAISESIVDIIAGSDDEDESYDDVNDIAELLADVLRSWCRPSRSLDFDLDDSLESAIHFLSSCDNFKFDSVSSSQRLEHYVADRQRIVDERRRLNGRFETLNVHPEFCFGNRVVVPPETDEDDILVENRADGGVSFELVELTRCLLNLHGSHRASRLLAEAVAYGIDADDDASRRFLVRAYDEVLVSEPVRVSIRERIPLMTEMTLVELADRIADIALDADVDYNVAANFDALVNAVDVEIGVTGGFVELCEASAASKTIFGHVRCVLVALLERTGYDFRIVALIRSCTVAIERLLERGTLEHGEAALIDDLYARGDLPFRLGFRPDVLLDTCPETYERTVDDLVDVYAADRAECAFYLCRFTEWCGALGERILKAN